ncbi:MAG: hypothetical protein HY549_05660 [Elusimicrobia bacterium]|nr:hypothetical protein [Elusimicrobiota bacterium]
MHNIALLCRDFLSSPREAAERCRRPESFRASLMIYAAFVVCYALFFWLKPWDFPEVNAPWPQQELGLLFWLKVLLWQPALEGAWIALLLGLISWFGAGSMAFRLLTAVAWAAGPIMLMAYHHSGALSRPAFAAGSVLAFGAFIPLWRKVETRDWISVTAFMLGLNVIGLAGLIPMALAIWLRHELLFKIAQFVSAFWMLGAGAAGLKALSGLRLPRVFMAIMLSVVFQVTLAFSLYLVGLVPKDVLKALLYP